MPGGSVDSRICRSRTVVIRGDGGSRNGGAAEAATRRVDRDFRRDSVANTRTDRDSSTRNAVNAVSSASAMPSAPPARAGDPHRRALEPSALYAASRLYPDTSQRQVIFIRPAYDELGTKSPLLRWNSSEDYSTRSLRQVQFRAPNSSSPAGSSAPPKRVSGSHRHGRFVLVHD